MIGFRLFARGRAEMRTWASGVLFLIAFALMVWLMRWANKR